MPHSASRRRIPAVWTTRLFTALWTAPFVIGLVLLHSLSGTDLLDAGELQVSVAYATLIVGGVLTALRGLAFRALERMADKDGAQATFALAISLVRDVVMLAVAITAAHLALELPWNENLYAIAPEFTDIESWLISCALVGLYFLGQRRGALVALGVAAFAGAGLAEYFVLLFKGTVILPVDVISIGTALSVSGGYTYVIDGNALSGICAGAAGIAAAAQLRPLRAYTRQRTSQPEAAPQPRGRHSAAMAATRGRHAAKQHPQTVKANALGLPAPLKATADALRTIAKTVNDSQAFKLVARLPKPSRRLCRAVGCILNIALALTCLTDLSTNIRNVDYKELGVDLDSWNPHASYVEQGILPSFVYAVQNMAIKQPAGYSDEAVTQAETTYAARYEASRNADERTAAEAQFSQAQPSIVAVMNETFSDLSALDGLGVGYTGPENFNAIPDAIMRGKLNVSAYGGGTCNSEFEFLTGNSLAYIGSGKYPYALYNLSESASLARQLGELGYATTAIHPNLASNWSRDVAYPQLGFDQFLDIDSFEGAPEFHSGVTDGATYEKVLELLRTNEQPQFVLDVTMQNHSGYDQENIDPELLRNVAPEGLDEETTAQLNEYLACIDASDRDLAWFIEQLRGLDRPVILVFFGDHQPNFSETINNLLYPDEEGAGHMARIFQTDYLVWANYDVAGTGETRVEDASSSTLAALTLDVVGGPLTQVQRAQLGIRLDVPMVSLFTYKDRSGSWYRSQPEATSGDGDGSDEEPVEEAAPGIQVAVDDNMANLDGAYADGAETGEQTTIAGFAKLAFEAMAKIQYRSFALKVQ